MAAVFVLFFRDDGLAGILSGLLVSGPLYLAVGYVLAKLGYRRQTYGQMREQRGRSGSDDRGSEGAGGHGDQPRARPAPTKRTGASSPSRKQTKRRR